MNFLGHCLFSEDSPAALAGSLWPDFARRPAPENCTELFIKHFDRHQWIDKTTDSSGILEPLRVQLRPVFRKTTPIVIDMIIDHHLANYWAEYHDKSLEQFAQRTYDQLADFDELELPERFKQTLYWMQKHNWFVIYRSPEGMKRALEGMSRRIKFDNPIMEHSTFGIQQTKRYKSEIRDFIEYLKTKLLHLS